MIKNARKIKLKIKGSSHKKCIISEGIHNHKHPHIIRYRFGLHACGSNHR